MIKLHESKVTKVKTGILSLVKEESVIRLSVLFLITISFSFIYPYLHLRCLEKVILFEAMTLTVLVISHPPMVPNITRRLIIKK